jgi:mannose-1-phosphate guanylyltransferase
LGAALIQARDPEAVMIVTPADHVIEPQPLFQRTLQAAVHLAVEHPQALITLGIPPTYPAIGYGYIECGEPLGSRLGIEAYRLRRFKEKPDFTTAQQYVTSGGFFWNSGIFIWPVRAIVAELERLRPELMTAVRRIAEFWTSPERETVFRACYEPLIKISIDHAVMEHCSQALVLRAPFTWDDLGSWPALARHRPQDASGNTILDVQHVGVRTRHCIIVGDSAEQLIATAGVEHLLIVRDGDALLVADGRDESAIKELVETLKAQGRSAFL